MEIIESKKPANLSPFITTHCATCEAGWLRTLKSGEIVSHCLLDREEILPNIVDCNRYQLREDAAP